MYVNHAKQIEVERLRYGRDRLDNGVYLFFERISISYTARDRPLHTKERTTRSFNPIHAVFLIITGLSTRQAPCAVSLTALRNLRYSPYKTENGQLPYGDPGAIRTRDLPLRGGRSILLSYGPINDGQRSLYRK